MLRKRCRFLIVTSLTFCLSSILFFSLTASTAKKATALKLTPQQIATILGWEPYATDNHICRGYYQEAPITMPTDAVAKETVWRADRVVLWRKKQSHAHGHIVLTQAGRQITGDNLTSYPNPKTHKPERWDIYGNVHLREPGMLAVGTEANVNMKKKTAILHNATFRYQVTKRDRQEVYNAQHQLKTVYIEGKNFRGQAKKIQQLKPKLIQLQQASLTACDPYSNMWKLKSGKLILNQTSGVGVAHNARLLIHGVPILYTPYFRFPIDNRRRSGFLLPGFSSSSISGINFNWPYYWNIAPNYDMTITPNYYSKRGLQLSSLFRYLNPLGNGQLYFSLLPDDKVFRDFQQEVANGSQYPTAPNNEKNKLANASTNRMQFAWQDNTRYNPYLSSNININYVSDDYYLQDFPNGAPFTNNNDIFADLLTTTQLTQSASLNFAVQHWAISTLVENFQTLHPVTLTKTKDQYARLPEIDINGSYPESFLGLNYGLNSQITDFQHPLLEGNFPTTLASVTGMRYHAAPAVDAYLGKPWGYLNPKLTIDGTFYSVANPVTKLQQKNSMERTLPIFDLDSGLYFDRETHFGNTQYIQTLEPRLFYLHVPYVNQDNLPLFDTSISPSFTFAQLFTTNRFQGFDRVGDANQVSLGVTSRFINKESGQDALDFSIGQIYYFRNRVVQANTNNPPKPLDKTDTEAVSPMVGELNWNFLRHWEMTGNFAYDTINHWMQNANLGVKYHTDNNHIITGSYSLVKQTSADNSNLKQINLGISWPISTRWQALSGVNYSISSNYTPTYLYGLQYSSCCWSLRVLTSRRYVGQTSDNTRKYDKTVYLQFLLTGLTSIGTSNNGSSSPSDILNYVIPGYDDDFGKRRFLNST